MKMKKAISPALRYITNYKNISRDAYANTLDIF